MTQPKISIIIPVFNEASMVRDTLLNLKDNSDVELIVVDGGSKDKTVELAKEMGVKVITSPTPGRANQMNIGALVATGDILLFLHIDTLLPSGYQTMVLEALSNSQTIAGAFKLYIDSPKRSLRFVETMANLRSRFCSLAYGDQAIFLKKSVFEHIGGFTNLPIMEDFELMQRLKRKGKITIAPAVVVTSSRRWQKLGVFKTTLINQLVIIGYYLGISPRQLRRLYQMF